MTNDSTYPAVPSRWPFLGSIALHVSVLGTVLTLGVLGQVVKQDAPIEWVVLEGPEKIAAPPPAPIPAPVPNPQRTIVPQTPRPPMVEKAAPAETPPPAPQTAVQEPAGNAVIRNAAPTLPKGPIVVSMTTLVPIDRHKPPYPLAARRMGREGTVEIMICITPAGEVYKVELLASSGHADLDQAAVICAKDWLFKPVHIGGRPATVWARQKIAFRLSD